MLLAESLTEQVIGLAIEVHRNTGPGSLDAVYEHAAKHVSTGNSRGAGGRQPPAQGDSE